MCYAENKPASLSPVITYNRIAHGVFIRLLTVLHVAQLISFFITFWYYQNAQAKMYHLEQIKSKILQQRLRRIIHFLLAAVGIFVEYEMLHEVRIAVLKINHYGSLWIEKEKLFIYLCQITTHSRNRLKHPLKFKYLHKLSPYL